MTNDEAIKRARALWGPNATLSISRQKAAGATTLTVTTLVHVGRNIVRQTVAAATSATAADLTAAFATLFSTGRQDLDPKTKSRSRSPSLKSRRKGKMQKELSKGLTQ